jgi:hypothetical protein
MASFTINPNLIAELTHTSEMREAMEHTARKIAETAQQIAPVGDPNEDDHPGQFKESIHAEGDQVLADDPSAVFIIFGTSHSPPTDTFRRAAEMNGAHVIKESA